MKPRARLPYRTLAVAAACVAAAAALPALRYDRAGILGGEAWRLLSGHMVHASPTHLVWDVAGLLAVGLLFEEPLGTRYWTALLVSALTVAACGSTTPSRSSRASTRVRAGSSSCGTSAA